MYVFTSPVRDLSRARVIDASLIHSHSKSPKTHIAKITSD